MLPQPPGFGLWATVQLLAVVGKLADARLGTASASGSTSQTGAKRRLFMCLTSPVCLCVKLRGRQAIGFSGYLPTCTKTTCGADRDVRSWYPQHESTLPSIVLKRPLVPDLNIPTWFSPVRKFEPSQSKQTRSPGLGSSVTVRLLRPARASPTIVGTYS